MNNRDGDESSDTDEAELQERVDYEKKKSDRSTSEQDEVDITRNSDWDVNLNLPWWKLFLIILMLIVILLIVSIIYIPGVIRTLVDALVNSISVKRL